MWRALEPNLLAFIGDRLAWLQWAKSKDAQRNRNQPKPIPRPGIGPKKDASVLVLPVDEVKRRLALPRRALEVPSRVEAPSLLSAEDAPPRERVVGGQMIRVKPQG